MSTERASRAARPSARKRARRAPAEARRQILDAAEALLASGGVHAVSVRSVAERIGMTDMGVNHHFGTREGLLEALLDEVAARLRRHLVEFSEQWLRAGAGLSSLVELMAGLYTPGHTQLALALYAAGWRDRRTPLLEPVVQALHSARTQRLDPHPDLEETRLAVSALHQALALDPAFGAEFRRSAGLTGIKARDPMPMRRWWLTALSRQLGLPV